MCNVNSVLENKGFVLRIDTTHEVLQQHSSIGAVSVKCPQVTSLSLGLGLGLKMHFNESFAREIVECVCGWGGGN